MLAAARARGQSNDLNREILASNLFNCRKEVINAPPVPSISRCIHIVYRHKNVWEYQWSNFIYNCMSTFLHYVHCKDALLDCSAPGGERCESLTWVDEIVCSPIVYTCDTNTLPYYELIISSHVTFWLLTKRSVWTSFDQHWLVELKDNRYPRSGTVTPKPRRRRSPQAMPFMSTSRARQTSSISRTKPQHLAVSGPVLQLSLPIPLKAGVNFRMVRLTWEVWC